MAISKIQILGDVEGERGVAFVQVLAHLLSIHIDDGIMVDGLEMQSYRLALHIWGDGQCATVDSLASIVLKPIHDIISMGHANGLPLLVIHRELPLAIERDILSLHHTYNGSHNC